MKHEYRIHAVVTKGDARGRAIRMITDNLFCGHETQDKAEEYFREVVDALNQIKAGDYPCYGSLTLVSETTCNPLLYAIISTDKVIIYTCFGS